MTFRADLDRWAQAQFDRRQGPARRKLLARLIRAELAPDPRPLIPGAYRGPERMVASRPGLYPIEPVELPTILIEHGLLLLDNSISWGTFQAAYYGGQGTAQPLATDHVYGLAAATGAAYTWEPDPTPQDGDPSIATSEQLIVLRAVPERSPPLWTGLARHVAQIWGPWRDITQSSTWEAPAQLPRALAQSGAQYLPGAYGLVRDLHQGVLAYWLIYCGGGIGGIGGTGDGAISANGVGAVRCIIDPLAQAWADALVLGEHPPGHPLEGHPLTTDDRRMYEAVVVRTLKVDPAASAVEVYPDMGDDSAPWSFRAHGMQWRDTELGDIEDTGGECRAVQWRRNAADLVQHDYRTPIVTIAFTGPTGAREPVASVSGLAASGVVCWQWDRVGLWVDGARVVNAYTYPGDGLPTTWEIARDSAGPLYGYWDAEGEWQEERYEGATEVAGTGTLGDTLPKYGCGEISGFDGLEFSGGTGETISAFGFPESANVSGTSLTVWSGTVADGLSSDNFDGYPPYLQWFEYAGWCPAWAAFWPPFPAPPGDTGDPPPFAANVVCMGSTETVNMFYSVQRKIATLNRRNYGSGSYVVGGFALVVSPRDPRVIWRMRTTEEQRNTLEAESQRSATIIPRITGAEKLTYYVGPWVNDCGAAGRIRENRYDPVSLGTIGYHTGWGSSNVPGATGVNAVSAQSMPQIGGNLYTSSARYVADVQTVVAGALRHTESISLDETGDIYDSGGSVSWDHVRAWCVHYLGDDNTRSIPFGATTGLGAALYQRWTGDDPGQTTDGYPWTQSGVPLGVA